MSAVKDSVAIEEALGRSLIVIPSINGGALVERMLPSLRVPGRIVVVLDQGSTDNTTDVCARHGVEIVQLGEPRTYTEACNIGIKLAKARDCEFIFFSNNDIVFTTDVARELLGELIEDVHLGMVAPSQVIVNGTTGEGRVSYRSYWDLSKLKFAHDYTPPPLGTKRLESDFCELTFALARVEVMSEIGGLDNEFGFYHEDADLGFRLREAGYACAYLPQSQIEHYAGSTFGAKSDVRDDYISRSKATFARKHLGYGLKHDLPAKDAVGFDASLVRQFHFYLKRYGLLDESTPEIAAPTPIGVDADVFHPWGPVLSLIDTPADGTTFLWRGDKQDQGSLAELLAAWKVFFSRHRQSRLLLVGPAFSDLLNGYENSTWRSDTYVVRSVPDAGIMAFETSLDVDAQTMAAIYRGVDFLVSTSSGPIADTIIAEAMTCGTPAITANRDSAEQLILAGSLTGEAGQSPAARHEAVLRLLTEADQMAGETYDHLSAAGVRLTRSRFTWRDTVMKTREAVSEVQQRKSVVPAAAHSGSADTTSQRRQKEPAGTTSRTAKLARQVRKVACWLSKGASSRG